MTPGMVQHKTGIIAEHCPPSPMYLPSVYLMASHVTRSPRSSLSVFIYCKEVVIAWERGHAVSLMRSATQSLHAVRNTTQVHYHIAFPLNSAMMNFIVTYTGGNYQVATTLLVAGPTLTLWIPGQTLFASTSSY